MVGLIGGLRRTSIVRNVAVNVLLRSTAVLNSALSDGTLLSNPQELSKVLSAGISLKFQRASKDEGIRWDAPVVGM